MALSGFGRPAVTEVDLARFYACAGDPVAVAARLVAKAMERAESMVVCGAPEQLERLSQGLWNAPGFLAHAGPGASEPVQRHSAVRLQASPPSSEVPLLLNLGAELDLDALRVRRLFDVFGAVPAQRQAARERFRRCQQAGWPTETVQVGR